MAKLTTTLIIGTALIAVAGCSKKRPETLPPAPSETAPPVEQTTTPTGPTTPGVAPGSAADFQQSVTADTVHFDLDQYDTDSPARAILDSPAPWLAKYPTVPLPVAGPVA